MGARLGTASPSLLTVVATMAFAAAVGLAAAWNPAAGIALAAGAAFVALVFVDLLIGFAAVVAFAYLEMYSSVGAVSVTKLVGGLVAVAWLAALTAGGRDTRNFFAERPGLTYLLALFAAWAAISVVWAPLEGPAVESVQRYALNIILVPIAYAAVAGPRDVVRVLAVIVAAACVAAATGMAGGVAESAPGSVRASGSVGDPNELAAGLVVAIAIAAAFAVNRHVSLPARGLALAAAAICLAGMLATLSRGGLLGLVAAMACAIVVGGRWRGRVLAACGAVALAAVAWFAVFASLPAKERVLNVGGGGTGRLDLWTVAERMIDANPLLGVGTGQFATSSVSYLLQPGAIQRGDFILSAPKVAHNTYLNVAAELGLVGAALFVAILLTCVGFLGLAVRELRRAGDERLEILARGLAAGLGGYLVTLLFISENYSKLLWALFALGPALYAVARSRRAGFSR